MLAFLACVFYVVFCLGVLMCVSVTALYCFPRFSMGMSMLMDEEIKKHGEQELRKMLIKTAALTTLVGKLLYLICWHFA